jgi:phosphate starvation-inducible PhoH-like protein
MTLPQLGGLTLRTPRQVHYVEALRDENLDLIFGVGPAGTGKTFLAVAAAVEALKQERVDRIIVTRPAVEAGEKLGYLPGDLGRVPQPDERERSEGAPRAPADRGGAARLHARPHALQRVRHR